MGRAEVLVLTGDDNAQGRSHYDCLICPLDGVARSICGDFKFPKATRSGGPNQRFARELS